MSLLRPTNEFARGSGVSPVTPAASAWTELQVSDLTLDKGGHTYFTHGAGSGGYTHRKVLDASVRPGILALANSACLDDETGRSLVPI